MRYKILVRYVSDGILTYDYQYSMASMLYKKLTINNEELANKLHATKDFGRYVVSNLSIDNLITTKEGLIFDTASFSISSLDTDIIEGIIEGFLFEPSFNLGKERFIVTKIERLKPRILKSPCTFRSLSPISVDIQKLGKNGKLIPLALYPDDPRWNEQVTKGLIKRYTSYYNKPPLDTHFDISNIKSIKQKAITIGSNERASYCRCSLVTFDVDASTELLNFVYQMGIGQRTSMGCGFLSVYGNTRNNTQKFEMVNTLC